MTITEKIEMYKNKKHFVEGISEVFETLSNTGGIKKISYELYEKVINENTTYFCEYIVVTFEGGGKSPINVNGNSNTANFKAISKLINGGYYDEVEYYKGMEESGFERVIL